MKKRHLIGGILLLVSLAVLAVLAIPESPLFLPELLVPTDLHEGRSVKSWTKDLESDDAKLRAEAVFALGTIGKPAEKSVPAMATMMREDPDVDVRASAALALSKMGPTAKGAVPALAEALSDEISLVRMNAALALRGLGQDAREAVPALLRALQEESNIVYVDRFVLTVQEMVALALARATAGTEEGVAPLMEVLKSTKKNTQRTTIIRGLGEIGPSAKAAVPMLQELKVDKDKYIREAAERALQQIGEGQA